MKEQQLYDIYRKRRVYAVVDRRGNYSLNIESEEPDGFVNFRQDGTWTPIEFADAPAWLKEQIEESEAMEPDDYDTTEERDIRVNVKRKKGVEK